MLNKMKEQIVESMKKARESGEITTGAKNGGRPPP